MSHRRRCGRRRPGNSIEGRGNARVTSSPTSTPLTRLPQLIRSHRSIQASATVATALGCRVRRRPPPSALAVSAAAVAGRLGAMPLIGAPARAAPDVT